MKLQVGINFSMIDSKATSDADIRAAMKLGKNEVVALDVAALAEQIAQHLKDQGVKMFKRSSTGGLNVSCPVKVEAAALKASLSDVAPKKSKKTEEEKKASLLASLGL